MKVMVISTKNEAAARYELAKASGYITFVYEHADPLHQLAGDKFMYVASDEELTEKIALVRADVTVAEQVRRF